MEKRAIWTLQTEKSMIKCKCQTNSIKSRKGYFSFLGESMPFVAVFFYRGFGKKSQIPSSKRIWRTVRRWLEICLATIGVCDFCALTSVGALFILEEKWDLKVFTKALTRRARVRGGLQTKNRRFYLFLISHIINLRLKKQMIARTDLSTLTSGQAAERKEPPVPLVWRFPAVRYRWEERRSWRIGCLI